MTGERIIFWTLPAVAVIWIAAFFVFPGFVPPMSPRASAGEVAAFYTQDLSRIRYSMILFNWFCVALIPLLMLIVERMRHMAHRTPVLRYCMIGVSGAAPIAFLTSTVFWFVAAFRPDRAVPELTLLLNDLAWITFTCGVPFLTAMCVFLAISIAYDDRTSPCSRSGSQGSTSSSAPRLVPACFAGFSKSGVFAWDGFVSFWIKNAAIALWITVMAVLVAGAMERDRNRAPAAA